MNYFKIFVCFSVMSLSAFTTFHKYYISVTQIEYVKDKESVQIITRVFLDDLENLLKQHYDASILLEENEELPITNAHIEQYLKDKINVKINGHQVNINFIGKEYALDIMKCYLEIEGINAIKSFEISNKLFFEMFDNQQNIIKTNINSRQNSFILVSRDDHAVLNFN